MITLRVIIINYEDIKVFIVITAVYAIISATTSVFVVHYNDILRNHLRKRKLQANMAKARAVRWDIDYRDIEERCESLCEGELK